MSDKLYYMIGLLVTSNRTPVGYRVINKVTYEIKDIRDCSEVKFEEIDNLEMGNKKSRNIALTVGVRCNAGRIERYSIIDVDRHLMIQSKFVVIMQNAYFTVVDHAGKVVLLTKKEFMKLVDVCGIDAFANVKKTDGSDKRCASIGCIKTPFDLFKSQFWKDESVYNKLLVRKIVDTQMKARINAFNYLDTNGIPVIYSEQICNNRNILNVITKDSDYNHSLIVDYINENMDSVPMYDIDLVKRLLNNYKAVLEIGTYKLRNISGLNNKDDTIYEIEPSYREIFKENKALTYDEMPSYLDICVRPYRDTIQIAGTVGRCGSNNALVILFEYNIYNECLNYITYKENPNYSRVDTKENYERAKRLIGKNVDKVYKLSITRDGDKVLNNILDMHQKISSLDGYKNLGTGLSNKKPIDFNKDDLEKYGLTIKEIEETFKYMGVPSYDNTKVIENSALLLTLPINRYEYIKIYKVSKNTRLPRVEKGEWRASEIDSQNMYRKCIIALYTEGKCKTQFIWFLLFQVTYMTIEEFIYNTFLRVFPIKDTNINLREKYIVASDIIHGLENVGKSISILPKTLFSVYNPFGINHQQLSCLVSEKKDEDRVAACWGYGVSLVNGGYYIYIKAAYTNVQLSESERSLCGNINTTMNNRVNHVVIPILRFKTYNQMYECFMNVIVGNVKNSKKFLTEAISFAEIVLRNRDRSINKIGLRLLDELFECSITHKQLPISTIEEFIGKSIEEAGVII